MKTSSGNCALWQANYTLDDAPVPWLFPHFPVLPYGDYRFRLKLARIADTEPTVCFCVDGVVMPKV